jgi:hypothetical protein
MSYAMSYAMLYASAYDMQVKTYDVVYDDSIRCRTSDLRRRINIRHRMVAMSYVLRHRMLRCRTYLTYDIDIRCRTSCTYDIVYIRCRTCMTYDIVCNIGIIRCRTSDVRHRTSARIQMVDPKQVFSIFSIFWYSPCFPSFASEEDWHVPKACAHKHACART